MLKNYQKLISLLPDPQPDLNLQKTILLRLEQRHPLTANKYYLIFFGFLLTGSLVAFFPTFHLLQTDLNRSGFWQFFSLLFSDLKTVSNYWHSFGLTLLESLPITNIIILLGVLLIFIQSLRLFTKHLALINKPFTNFNHHSYGSN